MIRLIVQTLTTGLEKFLGDRPPFWWEQQD
jgi:hypothetical protein